MTASRHSAKVAAIMVLIAIGSAAQDSYPSRPVRLVVGVAPGSAADISLRLLALKLSQILGGQFVVENRTGAGTSLAAQTVVQSPKDGYTLMYGGSANTVNATLSPNLGFDFAKDLDPVARIAAAAGRGGTGFGTGFEYGERCGIGAVRYQLARRRSAWTRFIASRAATLYDSASVG